MLRVSKLKKVKVVSIHISETFARNQVDCFCFRLFEVHIERFAVDLLQGLCSIRLQDSFITNTSGTNQSVSQIFLHRDKCQGKILCNNTVIGWMLPRCLEDESIISFKNAKSPFSSPSNLFNFDEMLILVTPNSSYFFLQYNQINYVSNQLPVQS